MKVEIEVRSICNQIHLETDRLFIRILGMSDKNDFFAYRSLPEIYQFQGWRPKDITEIEDLGFAIEEDSNDN